MHNLIKNAKIVRLTVDGTNYQAASGVDGGAVDSGILDTQGYDSIDLLFLRGGATNAHVLAIKLQNGDSATMTDAADVTLPVTTVQTITDVGGNKTNRMVCYSIRRPKKRYLRFEYQRTTQNSQIDGIVAILYNASDVAPTNPTTAGGHGATPIVLNGP